MTTTEKLNERDVILPSSTDFLTPCFAITRGGDVVYSHGRQHGGKRADGAPRVAPTAKMVNRDGDEFFVWSGVRAGICLLQADAAHLDIIHLLPSHIYPSLYPKSHKGISDQTVAYSGQLYHHSHIPTADEVRELLKDILDGVIKFPAFGVMAEKLELELIKRTLKHLYQLDMAKAVRPATTKPATSFTDTKAEPEPDPTPRSSDEDVPTRFVINRPTVATVSNATLRGNLMSVAPTGDGCVRLCIGAHCSAMKPEKSKWSRDDLGELIDVLMEIKGAL